jgi:hypothetical protein
MIKSLERFACVQFVFNIVLVAIAIYFIFLLKFYRPPTICIENIGLFHIKEEAAFPTLVVLEQQEIFGFPKLKMQAFKSFDPKTGKEVGFDLHVGDQVFFIPFKKTLFLNKELSLQTHTTPLKVCIEKKQSEIELAYFVDRHLEKKEKLPLITRAIQAQLDQIDLKKNTLNAQWYGADQLDVLQREKLNFCNKVCYLKKGERLGFKKKWEKIKDGDLCAFYLVLQEKGLNCLTFDLIDANGKAKTTLYCQRKEDVLELISLSKLEWVRLRSLTSFLFTQGQKKLFVHLKEPLFLINNEWKTTPKDNVSMLVFEKVTNIEGKIALLARLYSPQKSIVKEVSFIKKDG